MHHCHTDESNFVTHEPCPKCGSSDGCSLYSDGHRYCFVCNTYFPSDDAESNNTSHVEHHKMSKELASIEEFHISDLSARKINKETCAKYKYYVGKWNGKPCQMACYYNDKGVMVGQKLRFPNKEFLIRGDISTVLYGANLWQGDKMIVITEGEVDCLSVSQAQENRYPVVSIPNGASAAKKAIEANIEYLSNFEKVILMFDMDEPGRAACEACAKILPVGKAYIATLPLKDANECLKAGKTAAIIQAIWNAKPYRPDGIVAGVDLHDKCVSEIEDLAESTMYPWKALNAKTRGARYGELYVFTSGSGMGKSTILRELEYYFGVVLGEHCGIIALEESTRKTGLELMSLQVNKRLTLDPTVIDEQARDKAFIKTVGNGNFFLYDHFGSLDSDNLLSKIRYMIVALGCKRIFLDHISIVVSGMDNDEDGGERKAIDKLMTNLRSLVEETNATMFVVSHLRRPEKKGHEEGGQISLSQLRGSGGIAQLSDMVIGLERDQQGDTPNVLTLRVLKNRFSGDTGVSGHLYYDPDTGRLSDYDGENTSVSSDFTPVDDTSEVAF